MSSKPYKAMTASQYKAAIEAIGLSQVRAGEWLGLAGRTGQRYAAEGPPKAVAMLLRLMLNYGLHPEDVENL